MKRTLAMRLGYVLIAAGALAVSAATAQPTSNLASGSRERGATRPVAKSTPAKSCAEFGPGFVMVEGSTTCARVGGSVSVGVGGSSSRGR